MKLNKINPEEIGDNPFTLIGTDWMLITGGVIKSFNTMTASWGGLGVLWNKRVCYIFVRPTRYTYEFIEQRDVFTLSFFEEEYRNALNFCGTKSGRNVDKIAKTGLSPVEDQSGAVYFDEARLVLVCKKIYFQNIIPEQFLDPEIDKNYPEKDYHRMYVGQILQAYRK
jgi:flavin reductase (DIM6/NTAB) family NADH-FMN oxidoreductase RutF